MQSHLVPFPNVELHDSLLAFVENRGCHGQLLPSLILLPQKSSQLLEGTGLISGCWVDPAAVRLAWLIQLDLSYQEGLVPVMDVWRAAEVS